METVAIMPGNDDVRTFEALLEQHRGIVLKVAASYARNLHDRADLAQEIAAQLWRAWPEYDPERRFSTWMYRVALNVAISHLREAERRGRHTVPLDEKHHDIAGAGPNHDAQAQVQLLHRFMATLDPLNRALLLLYLEERSGREIAEVLGISESNVTTRVSRLKRRIHDYITPTGR